MSTKDTIRNYIATELGWTGSLDDLTDDYPLLETEVVDSLGIFKIIAFIESEFDVEVEDDELVADNFQTVGAIARLVGGKVGG